MIGLGLVEEPLFKKVTDWLKTHNGRLPRASLRKAGRKKTVAEMTEEEKEEVDLYRWWSASPEKKAFDACKGIPLDELPEEYQQYREEIAILRQFEEMRRANELDKRMKRAVGNHVGDNNQTREDLNQILKQSKKGRTAND